MNIGWESKPEWHIFKLDKSYEIIKPGDPSPCVLLSMRGGLITEFPGIISEVSRPFPINQIEGDLSVNMTIDTINPS